jgi:hypothetical protein
MATISPKPHITSTAPLRYDVDVDWHEYLQNPEAVTERYEDVPPLASVELTKLELLREGPTVILSLILPTYPTRPPARWASRF